MGLLPEVADAGSYFRDVHRAADHVFAPALDEVTRVHGLPPQRWRRSRLGRNVVFLGADLAVKLGPPLWRGDLADEAAALRFVRGRLPVATPELVATGELDGWEHLVTTRLPGEPLRDVWRALPLAARCAHARRHGEVAAALHALPNPPALPFDWTVMFREQRAALVAGLVASGVAERLVATAEAYVDAAPPRADGPPVLTHGDLSDLNYLHVADGGGLGGLVDWGDVRVGRHAAHDVLSPAVHTYLGERPVWRAFWEGLGVRPDDGLRRELTVRAMLYYADELGAVLRRVPGADTARTWDHVADRLWGITPGGGAP